MNEGERWLDLLSSHVDLGSHRCGKGRRLDLTWAEVLLRERDTGRRWRMVRLNAKGQS